jgi:hypothetical protein
VNAAVVAYKGSENESVEKILGKVESLWAQGWKFSGAAYTDDFLFRGDFAVCGGGKVRLQALAPENVAHL